MILLLEPERPPAFVSGGYRYQAEIGRRLRERGEGDVVAVAPPALAAAAASALAADGGTGVVVVDGLFAALGAPLPAGAIALLHTVPEPRDWLRDRPPAIATGAPTAEAVRALVRDVLVVRPGLDPCFTTAGNAPRGAPDAVQVVAVGTVAPGKGQLLLVQALRTAGAPCQLTLLGDLNGAPDYVTAVRAAVGPLPVQLRGVVPPEEVAAVLRGADLFVSASRSESFGMAVAEAAACGVPVLAFATGEIPALVRDGATGWLLPPDAPDAAFTTALHDIVRAPERLAAARRAHGMPVLPGWEQAAAAFRDACLALTGGAERGGTAGERPPA